ncbi:hypothetical protein [Sorangium sp. So ce381]|uniref:hypothetical protein n=1 Tax=Sorangium sp. So ce381 TaxID=3133307 RepID=UPI003F5CA445
MRRSAIVLVLPVLAWMLSACGGAQAPEQPAAKEGEAEICPTGDPGVQPCPEGCVWDEKVQKCNKDRGIIVHYTPGATATKPAK